VNSFFLPLSFSDILTICNYYYNKSMLMCNIDYVKKAERGRDRPQASFLLAQIGAHAANRFAERLTAIDLTPAEAGILRLLSKSPGMSQQELADRLNIHASRLVAIIDGMVARRLVERQRTAGDRRVYSLQLTETGQTTLMAVGQIAREHHLKLCASLTEEERTMLGELLQRIADEQGLTPDVHPGYGRMGKR
jgi:DNA-binding MarR family transcriptional regulator